MTSAVETMALKLGGGWDEFETPRLSMILDVGFIGELREVDMGEDNFGSIVRFLRNRWCVCLRLLSGNLRDEFLNGDRSIMTASTSNPSPGRCGPAEVCQTSRIVRRDCEKTWSTYWDSANRTWK